MSRFNGKQPRRSNEISPSVLIILSLYLILYWVSTILILFIWLSIGQREVAQHTWYFLPLDYTLLWAQFHTEIWSQVDTNQGAISIQGCHLTSIGIPIIKTRWSHGDFLVFIMGFPIPRKDFTLSQGPMSYWYITACEQLGQPSTAYNIMLYSIPCIQQTGCFPQMWPATHFLFMILLANQAISLPLSVWQSIPPTLQLSACYESFICSSSPYEKQKCFLYIRMLQQT